MKKVLTLLAGLFIALTFSGCAGISIDELYSLPRPQEEYLQLQALIDAEIAAGSEYSAPTAGSQRQSVQQTDLNEDGYDEVLVFLKNRATVPVICIYMVENGQYVPICTISGEGSAIGRVEYSDLDGDGIQEIIVSWKISGDIAAVSAYSIKDWEPSVILSANCRDFLVGSMTDDGNPDLMILNFGDNGGIINMYSVDSTGETDRTSAPLSASLTSADRLRYTAIEDGAPALLVEGHYTEEEQTWYLTDIFTVSGSQLKNITLDEKTGNSATARAAVVYSQDIDGDGIMEIPYSEKVYQQPNVSSDYYVYDWVKFKANGRSSLCASTYHCQSDGWFYVIPEAWRDSFTVRRETGKTGERTVVLSTVDEDTGEVTDKLVIYTLSGENRRSRAKLPDRFTLASGETTIYAAELKTHEGPPTEEEKQDISGRFHLIYSEWIQGVL